MSKSNFTLKKNQRGALTKDLLVIIVKVSLVIFFTEFFLMVFLDAASINPSNIRDGLDALLLVCIASPILYLLIIKPYIQSTQSAREKAEALQNSEEQLRLVLEGADLGFWDWDILSGKVIRNARWANMIGYTYDEIQHTTQQWTDFIHP